MPYVSANDLNMYYRTAGEGPPVLMIMGWCANADWWPPDFVEPLATRFRLIMIDNRGAGRTGGNAKGFTIKKAAADTIAFLDAMNLDRVHVIGVSMGGMITQQLALDYPDRVDHVVLACTTCGLPGGWPIGAEQFKLAWRYLTRRVTRRRPYILNLLFTEPYLLREPGVGREAVRRIGIARMDRRTALQQFLGIARFGTGRRLSGMEAPALVITGSRDVMLPARNSRILAKRIPNTRLEILEEAGHGFFHEQAEQATRSILEFLPRTGAAS